MIPTYVNAVQAYRNFGLPRSLLRDLAKKGIIRTTEKYLPNDRVMFLYNSEDIQKYLNEA